MLTLFSVSVAYFFLSVDPEKDVIRPDKVYFYSQKDERRDSWMTPVFPSMRRYNPTPNPAWWGETMPLEPQEESDDIEIVHEHESDFL